MPELTQLTCTACRADAPKATPAEVEEYLRQIPEWKLINKNGIDRLERVYRFSNFVQALAFTNNVGQLAEAEDHHPAILTEWGQVTVSWWTHKIGGLHINDFISAAKTDRLYKVET